MRSLPQSQPFRLRLLLFHASRCPRSAVSEDCRSSFRLPLSVPIRSWQADACKDRTAPFGLTFPLSLKRLAAVGNRQVIYNGATGRILTGDVRGHLLVL